MKFKFKDGYKNECEFILNKEFFVGFILGIIGFFYFQLINETTLGILILIIITTPFLIRPQLFGTKKIIKKRYKKWN